MLVPQPGPVEPVVADATFLFTSPLSIRLRTEVLAHLLLAPELLVAGTADIRRRRLHAATSLCTCPSVAFSYFVPALVLRRRKRKRSHMPAMKASISPTLDDAFQ